MSRQSAKREGACIVASAPWTAAMAVALMPLSLPGQSTTPLVFAGLQTTQPVSSPIARAAVAIFARSSQKTVASSLLTPAAMAADTAGSRSKSTKENTHGK